MKIVKKIWSITSTIIITIIIVLMIGTLVLRISGNNVSLLGINFYYISSPSMEPTLEVGDMIVSKNVKNYSKLEVDDVITYKGEVGSYKGKLITHQIIEIKEENDSYTFITKGTKPGSQVDPEVREDQVVSKMLFELPFIGKIVGFLSNRIAFFFLLIVPLAVLLVFETKNLFVCFKKEEVENEEEN